MALVAQGQLHLDREAHRVHHAGKLHQHAIAGQLADAAVVLDCPGIDEVFAVALVGGQGAGLIRAHQAE